MAKSEARNAEVVRKLGAEQAALKLILSQMQQRMGACQQRLCALTADHDGVKAKYDAAMAQMDGKNEALVTHALCASDLKSEHRKLHLALKDATRRLQQLQPEHAAVTQAQRAQTAQMAELERARGAGAGRAPPARRQEGGECAA